MYPNWKPSIGHIAQEPISCAGYGPSHVIQKGDLYTLHKPNAADYYYSQHAFCRLCIPFMEMSKTRREIYEEYLQSELKIKDDLQLKNAAPSFSMGDVWS